MVCKVCYGQAVLHFVMQVCAAYTCTKSPCYDQAVAIIHVLYVTSAVFYMHMYEYMQMYSYVRFACTSTCKLWWIDKHITEDTERCLLMEASAILLVLLK